MTTGDDAPIVVGLRIDVDTLRGTRLGVPRLLQSLAQCGVTGTFYFSVGPDNMGRHLWRLFKPTFLWKMLRSNAASLYGLDILLRGTFWPGPVIARRAGDSISATATAGHEVGFHAWDHHAWQMHVEDMSLDAMHGVIQRGVQEIERLTEEPVHTSAVAGWRATETTLQAKDRFAFSYNSDCRGDAIFVPVVDGQELAPQIPVTLPTYDELIGTDGINDQNYNQHILNAMRPDALNVYTIHGEVEGIARADLFVDLLAQAKARNIVFVPLRQLLADVVPDDLPRDAIELREMPGREGWVTWQRGAL
jgi:undecaprenyl phosphate-alpha-L-ara4FN deformylase